MHDGWQYLMLMRHGHSFANAAIKKGSDSHFYSISGSDDRIELDELGKLEASKMSRVLSRLFRTDKPLTKIWTSSYVRVTQTADIIVGTLKYPVERCVDRRLAKRSYGKFWNLSYRGVEELYPEENKKFIEQGRLHYRPPEGENYFDLFARADDFYDKEIAASQNNVLLVTHSVVLLALQRRLENLSDEDVLTRYEQESVRNGSTFFYRRQASTDPWQLFATFVPDMAHLSLQEKSSLAATCAAAEACCMQVSPKLLSKPAALAEKSEP